MVAAAGGTINRENVLGKLKCWLDVNTASLAAMPFLPRKTGELPCYGAEFYRVEDENKSQFLVYTKSSKTGREHAILFSVQTWEPLRPAPEQCSTFTLDQSTLTSYFTQYRSVMQQRQRYCSIIV